ncbi:hypothetical protein SKDZ_04G5760 [Saccharomyces kudriavzevii ZP591]|uniref:NADPH:adrenodoxin oxidoreductase, mitochondrial n=1 Tax=Saccharomyces cerevisiae x Saccharomyces kudriavzevii (strain VIN7) TaxID=1095631 RepID=H0GT93_SACCK|nr:Arh1p [Saccharomyces cerevisiae x Saccharomyces kudriavzevii VIN7]CAI4059054.1 hypothetical protein SKDZ_04G5760 [Saccharomyces kudriavzevii ZP591]
MNFARIRHFSSQINRKTVSIVGSGPSGFYTAYHLLKKSPIPLNVTIWEKLPIPFGLSRYGVAPDHPEVKNCEETFTTCAEEFSLPTNKKHKFSFVGGVTIGKEILLKTLLDEQDAVVLSYGCTGDRKLNIPGEQGTKGVFSSREFVNWYNGHPDFAQDERFTDFNWGKVSKVGIIGNGNVALDITRVLISSQIDEIWKATDISPLALKLVRKAPVKDVRLIARRDFVHSKFTNKELRELWELEKFGIRGSIGSKFFQKEMFDPSKYDRAFNRRVEMCSEYLKPFDERSKKNYKKTPPPSTGYEKFWELDYLKTPLEINRDGAGAIKSLTLCNNQIHEDNSLQLLKNSSNILIYDMDLLITSLGYAGIPLPEFSNLSIGFDRDHVANKQGRVLTTDGEIFPHLYASGWIRKGSQGVIASTMQDAFEVGDRIMQDLTVSGALSSEKSIDLSNIRHSTWEDWERINKKEVLRGRKEHKPRSKFLTLEELWSNIEDV